MLELKTAPCFPDRSNDRACTLVVLLVRQCFIRKKSSMWDEIKGNFIPGDLVVFVDESAIRSSWILGHALSIVRGVPIQTRTRHVNTLGLLVEADSLTDRKTLHLDLMNDA